MKIPLPLSLKVSLWLLLNLVLLGAVGGIFLVTQSGFGWDALVSGPAGRRLQAVADVIGAEMRAEPGRSHDALLARFSAVYGVEFSLFQPNGRQLAGPGLTLPDAVRRRLGETRGPRSVARPPRSGLSAPEPVGDTGDNFRSPAADSPPPPPPEEGSAPRPRFLMRAGDPAAYWAGVRLPPPPASAAAGQPGGPILLLRAPTLGATSLFLDLKPWLAAAAVAVGFSILFWLPLVRGITRALGQLTRATEKIADGRFDTRVDAHRRDELGRLGGAVNRMAARLDHLVSGQKRFLGDIAHELGSPLGRMQFGIGILEERAPAGLQPAVADVREEVQQMSALVHELLAFTQAGLRPRDAALVPVELAPLTRQVVTREAADDRVTITVPAGLSVQADADLLARALGNLVRNALRHAGDAGPITLSAASAPGPAGSGEVVIAVEDQGAGVPADTLARLGEPFYRPEFARSRETGGAGLGLAIVKSAIEACRGTVSFSNRLPRGFRAEVRLPGASAAGGSGSIPLA